MKAASIVKKTLMAISGLVWVVFLIEHLMGNLLILRGPESFNAYAEFMRGFGSLLYVAEAGLVFFLVMHIVAGFRVTAENKKARKNRYTSFGSRESGLASKTMIFGGILILVFIPIHLAMFKFGDWSIQGGLWGLTVTTFKNPLNVVFYVVVMLAVGLHLSHGFASAFQTLGATKPRWRERFKTAGLVLGWTIAAGFISLPIWSLLFAKV